MNNITPDSWDQNKYLPPTVYPITQLEAAQILSQAWEIILGYKPSINSLGVLFAQFGLETGYGKYAKNANFGNVKSSPTDGYGWTMFRCNEIINKKEVWYDPPSIYCRFRAFKNNLEGAINYIGFVSQKPRYAKAWQEVLNGNPEAYSIKLREAGYYTADITLYTKGVVSIYNAFIKKYNGIDLSNHIPPSNDTPIESSLTADELAHIQGQIALSLSKGLDEYFENSRTPEGSDIDYSSINDTLPIPMPQTVWSSLKNIFGGKK